MDILNRPITVLLSQPVTYVTASPTLSDIPTILSFVAIVISVMSLITSAVIYHLESKSKFRETYFGLVLQASSSYFKLMDLFIKFENTFRNPTFIPAWNSGNEELKVHVQSLLHQISDASLANFPVAKEMAEIVTFTFKRTKVVCFESNITKMRKIGNELGPMGGDLSLAHFVFLDLMRIEQNHQALENLVEGNKGEFEKSIENKPTRKKEFFEKYKEVFEDIRAFDKLYDDNKNMIDGDLNKTFIRMAKVTQGI